MTVPDWFQTLERACLDPQGWSYSEQHILENCRRIIHPVGVQCSLRRDKAAKVFQGQQFHIQLWKPQPTVSWTGRSWVVKASEQAVDLGCWYDHDWPSLPRWGQFWWSSQTKVGQQQVHQQIQLVQGAILEFDNAAVERWEIVGTDCSNTLLYRPPGLYRLDGQKALLLTDHPELLMPCKAIARGWRFCFPGPGLVVESTQRVPALPSTHAQMAALSAWARHKSGKFMAESTV